MILSDLSQAAARIPCSERWLADNLRAGNFPGHKIGRKWMLSDENITEIIHLCAVPTAFSAVSAESASSMTPTTARRVQRIVTPGNYATIGTRFHRPQGRDGNKPGDGDRRKQNV
jgi:hypothetical protein